MSDGDMEIAPGQCFRLTALSLILKGFEDPDWRFPQTLEGGVAIGVDEELPRAPAVYEVKVKWALKDMHDDPSTTAPTTSP